MKYSFFIFILISYNIAFANEWGRFEGSVSTKWLENNRDMLLIENFSYIGPDSVVWRAPKGSIVNGASIPRLAWSIIGGPYEGAYRNASVIHDVACDKKNRPWKDVHRAFYTAMRASEVNPIKAKIMYAAVYHFGPRWGLSNRIELPKITMQQFGIEIHKIKMNAGPGTQVVISSAGETITEKKGFLGMQEEQKVVGAIVDVYQIQPKFSEQAFNNMQKIISAKDLTLDEIEALPAN